jgi:hypothetical protein
MLKIINYSDKSIVVVGDGTKTHKDTLKLLGGSYNPNLKGEAGWVFSKKATEKVQTFLESIGQDHEINSVQDIEEVKGGVSGVKNFCSSLSKENISDSRKGFTELDPVAQKLFLHWGWEILSHRSKYPEDTYIVAYKLFRLFRGKEGSSIPSYEKYSKMPLVDKIYSQASVWKRGYDKEGTPTEEKDSSSESVASKPAASKPVASKPTASTSRSRSRSSRSSRSSTSSRSRSGSAKASKKYDKEYQRYAEPESEIDPLYIYYTTLYQERPKSKLAIVWLTEHGVFSDDQRDELVKRYKKIKEG